MVAIDPPSPSPSTDNSKSRPLAFSAQRRLRPGSPADDIGRSILALLQSIEQSQGARRRARYPEHQRTFETTVSTVVANLIALCAQHPASSHSGLAVRLGKSAGTLHPSKYREACERGQLPYVLDLMAQPEAGLVVISKGKRGATSRTATVIHPGEGWVAFNRREAPCLRDIVHHPPREPIVLKAPRSRDPKQRQRAATWISYADTIETTAWRAQMERLNAALRAADLAIDASTLLTAPTRQIVIDLGDRDTRRYFNNGRFDHGGRLFGGFWQTMPSAQRSALRISGEPVAIVDYGSMFIRLLYARCGLDVDPSLDLYRVPGFEGYREGIKKVMAALLFREGRLERLPQGSRPLLPRGTKAAEVEDAVRLNHPGIEQHLGCRAVGFGLMFTESQILLAVLDACLEAGIVALPLHDAVAVPVSQAARVQGIMEVVYRQATGMSPAVGIKSASATPDSLSDPDAADEAET